MDRIVHAALANETSSVTAKFHNSQSRTSHTAERDLQVGRKQKKRSHPYASRAVLHKAQIHHSPCCSGDDGILALQTTSMFTSFDPHVERWLGQ